MKYLINLLHLLLTILQSEGRGASNNLINYHKWENYLGMCREEKNENELCANDYHNISAPF